MNSKACQKTGAKMERLKETNKTVRIEKGSSVKQHKQKDKERLTGQKGDCRNAYSITPILSFCAAAQHQCADYENII